MTVLAVEGSFASVLGGAPAAAVVFSRDVDARTASDPRVAELEGRLASASGVERARLATELAELRTSVRAEKLGQVASEFDSVHSIHRAVSVDRSTPSSTPTTCGAHHRRHRGGPAGLIPAHDEGGRMPGAGLSAYALPVRLRLRGCVGWGRAAR